MTCMTMEHGVVWCIKAVTITGITATNDSGNDIRNSRRPPRFCNETLTCRARCVTLWPGKDRICQPA